MQLRSFILNSLYIVRQCVYCLLVLFKVLSMLHLGVSGIILLIKEAPFEWTYKKFLFLKKRHLLISFCGATLKIWNKDTDIFELKLKIGGGI